MRWSRPDRPTRRYKTGRQLGALHGLPVALKDNIDTAGLRTTNGAAFLADRVPDTDAEVTRRLRDAGAVILGKLAMHELAFGATSQNEHYGPCRNPWDTERVPGGSSGGSGAAVAAGLCAAALGTDTGGSVRIPAALNGISAIRPTSGRISIRGVFPITWTLDTVGPMARAVSDLAALLEVLAGYDPGDPFSIDAPAERYREALGESVDGLRIGVPRSFFFEDVDEDIVRLVEAAGDVFASARGERRRDRPHRSRRRRRGHDDDDPRRGARHPQAAARRGSGRLRRRRPAAPAARRGGDRRGLRRGPPAGAALAPPGREARWSRSTSC